MCPQVPDQYGTIRAVSEGKGEEFLVGTSRNFILRGTFNDGFLGVVQVKVVTLSAVAQPGLSQPLDVAPTLLSGQASLFDSCVSGDAFRVTRMSCGVWPPTRSETCF